VLYRFESDALGGIQFGIETFLFTCPAGSANNRQAPGFIVVATSEKNTAADGISCTTANANAKSTFPTRSVTPREVLGVSRNRCVLPARFWLRGASVPSAFCLHVERHDSTGRADHAGKLKRKEAHAWTGFEHCHSIADVRSQNFTRIVKQPSYWAGQQIANPGGTNVLSHPVSFRQVVHGPS
jgi:hypothetical protein